MPDRTCVDQIAREMEGLKRLAERAIAQVSDEQLMAGLAADDNSIAILMKHLAGNMQSRWRDFLTTDGEKPDRNRDGEFELDAGDTRTMLAERWEQGWRTLFAALAELDDSHLTRTVSIRGEQQSVVRALHRQLAHYAGHVGQIVYLAKHHAGSHWETLSIPKGRSRDFNTHLGRTAGSGGL